MKKIVLILIAISVIAGSCRYKEGPVISFRSVHDRLLGTWSVIGYTSDGIDSLQFYKDSCGCGISFTNRQYQQAYDIWFMGCHNFQDEINGKYSFSDNKKIMHVYFLADLSIFGIKNYGPIEIPSAWEILRLTKNDFKIASTVNKHNYEVTFKKVNQ